MTDKLKPEVPELIACDICLEEIPSTAAQSMESDDYVYHFCGIHCYEQWQQQSKQQKKEDVD